MSHKKKHKTAKDRYEKNSRMFKKRGDSKCPQCNTSLKRELKALVDHYDTLHDRKPTRGESNQFLNFNPTRYFPEADFVKPKIEVQGGGVSPK